MHIEPQTALDLYRRMAMIRAFEKKLDFLFKRGMVLGTCHLCIGQEAIPVALCEALQPTDFAVGTHRGHGLALAKGVDPERLMAEIMGRADGVCGGRGGSQHVASKAHAFLGTNGITAGGLPLAAGAAFACKHRKNGAIVASLLGDGATNEGVFHETLNIAALWGLPILFVCENNLYGMSTSVERAASEPELWKRAAAYRMEAVRADGNDLESLLDILQRGVQEVRASQKPMFVECMTYRWSGHSKSDPRAYRSREEEAHWRDRCPLKKWRQTAAGIGVSAEAMDDVDREVAAHIDRIAEAALQSPEADPSTLHDHVYTT
jgi:pyruvate dehydrogenase E1 component alpha subunit